MKCKYFNAALAGLILSVSCAVNIAQAGLIAFNDRATFENYLNGESIDTLSSIKNTGFTGIFSSNDFKASGKMHQCNTNVDCGGAYDNMDNKYLLAYNNTLDFSFNSPIAAFGFDFNSYSTKIYNEAVVVALNGVSSQPTGASGGFFGIASDDGSTFSTVNFVSNLKNTVFDNITYAASVKTVPVPTPSTLAIFALAMIGLAARKFKR
ncbi:PEP-CTERM sorting domain-containing protein [Colwellia echini]|uniref:PEP-CTERM sorting domain-containing protein n=1 Tax=Colwellia echini TaxID=1982103 RepID=A0ABY3MX01_9GAMM|nr:PEP-CTERM sorting domain-containing protein [Colwellia echini]TYK65704.1 PEP-CTERM sorting domain-containing protein [Colwellia echini]